MSLHPFRKSMINAEYGRDAAAYGRGINPYVDIFKEHLNSKNLVKKDNRYKNTYKFNTKLVDLLEISKDCTRKNPLLIVTVGGNKKHVIALIHISIFKKMEFLENKNAKEIEILNSIDIPKTSTSEKVWGESYAIHIPVNEEKELREAVKYVKKAKFNDTCHEVEVVVKVVDI